MLPVSVILMPVAQQNHSTPWTRSRLKQDGRFLAGASSVARLHPTRAPSGVVLASLASSRRISPPSKPAHLSFAGTLWDGFRAIPARWQSAVPGVLLHQEKPGVPPRSHRDRLP